MSVTIHRIFDNEEEGRAHNAQSGTGELVPLSARRVRCAYCPSTLEAGEGVERTLLLDLLVQDRSGQMVPNGVREWRTIRLCPSCNNTIDQLVGARIEQEIARVVAR